MKIIVDNIKQFKNFFDVIYDMASEAIFCLFNITANEDSCYRTEVEEIEVEDVQVFPGVAGEARSP